MNRFAYGKARLLPLLIVMVLLSVATAGCVPDFSMLFVTTTDPGITGDGLAYDTNDILAIYDDPNPAWSKIFDGDQFGLSAKHNISAFSFNEIMWSDYFDSAVTAEDLEIIPELYLSFTANGVVVPGVGKVAGQDIVRFTELGTNVVDGPFEMFFDGSDVGLTTATERIDGIGVWPPEYFDFFETLQPDVALPDDCSAGVIFLTTRGPYRVPAAEGGSIVGTGSDVLVFCAFNTGPSTAGLWYRIYDGVAGGIEPHRAVTSIDVVGFDFDVDVTNPNSQPEDLDIPFAFLFTPRTTFTAPGLAEPGQPSQLFYADTEQGVGGPIVDFNDGSDGIPPINGVVEGISLFDLPFYTP